MPEQTSYRQEFEDKTKTELTKAKDELRVSIDSIKHQLDMNTALVENGEREADAVWEAKAKHALRSKKNKIKTIDDILSERDLFQSNFYNLVCEEIGTERYQELLNQAGL